MSAERERAIRAMLSDAADDESERRRADEPTLSAELLRRRRCADADDELNMRR